MEKRSPWAWIPSLYFAEGLPYVVVMTLSVIMYKRLGVSNTDIALFTSWLYFPWVIKPIWSPFVDLIKTKRWWIYSMQLLIGGGIAMENAAQEVKEAADYVTLSNEEDGVAAALKKFIWFLEQNYK
jgi:hypothetical protein